jgi:DNA repair protein RadC
MGAKVYDMINSRMMDLLEKGTVPWRMPFLRQRRKTMTIETLFGTEDTTSKPCTIKLKQIKAVYETLIIREDITDYLKTGARYTAPSQVYETFSFLMKETKEMFMTLHLDGKNRIICMDLVSMGSLNQSIVHPREVFKTACISNAAAIICVHQHPSGDASPSPGGLKRLVKSWVSRYLTTLL